MANEKSLLFQNFNITTEKEEYPITIEHNSSLTSDINFLNGVVYDTTIPELSASLTSYNTIKTISNSAALVSYTGLYSHASSYLYQDDYLYNEKIINSIKSETNYIREITLPINQFGDTIKKNSVKISLQKGVHEYSRFLRIKNDNSYDYGQNCAFVYFNDEKWALENDLNQKFSFLINFRLNNNWLEKITTTSATQYLIFKPRLSERNDEFTSNALSWTYAVSGSPCDATYEQIYNNKYNHNKDTLADGGLNNCAFSLRMTYYKSGSPHALSGKFVFETSVDGLLLETFPAISSSATTNALTGSLGSYTANANLIDGNWHQLLWSFKKDIEDIVFWQNRVFLDKVRLITNFRLASAGTANTVSIANYNINSQQIFAATPLLLGSKIEPIDNQVTIVNFKIYQASQTNIENYYKAKIIPAVYNIYYSSLTGSGLHWYAGKKFPAVSGSNTNIFSFFGSTDSRKFLNKYINYDTSDKIPNNNFIVSEIDEKKLLTSKIVSESTIKGFNGDIASFYIFNENIDYLYELDLIPDEYPLPGIVSDIGYFTSKQFDQKEPYVGNENSISASNLIGDYRFYAEDYKSSTVKNRIYANNVNYLNIENEDYTYYGAGIFINHENFRNKFNFDIPNCSITQDYDFYDIQETSLSSKLNHGKIFYKSYECGLIFYDLGIIVFDNDILIKNSTSSLLSSITTGTNFLFNNSTTSSTNFYFEEINYSVEKMNYNNYIDVILEEEEFNNTTNNTKLKIQDFSYPSTISFYNANDECLYVSKIKNVIEKNKFFKLIHKVKLSF